METVTFTIKYNAVSFEPFGQEVLFDESSLRKAIENIKQGRKNLTTESAYQYALNTYQNALEFLLTNRS